MSPTIDSIGSLPSPPRTTGDHSIGKTSKHLIDYQVGNDTVVRVAPAATPSADKELMRETGRRLAELYPRLGFKKAFTEALAEVARKKPHTAIGTGLVDIGRRLEHLPIRLNVA